MADPDLLAALARNQAAQQGVSGPTSAADSPIVPLWRVRPKQMGERVNLGQIGAEARTQAGGRATAGRVQVDFNYPIETVGTAGSSFLEMEDKDRDEFMKLAIQAGLIKPGSDGVSQNDVFAAWQRATGYAADYNSEKGKDKWISPWEAAQRLALGIKAGDGGSYDAFAPRTATTTTKRNFTKGSDAEGVTRSLESLFNEEMGRAPTQEERAVYQRLVQKAYDASPEVTRSTTTTDPKGNSNTVATQSGGIDMTATLLDRVRNDPEQQAHQAGVTFFQAAMQALGAIA